MMTSIIECPPDFPDSRLNILQRNNFRMYLANQVASQCGTWLQFVASAWLASEITGSGAALGWLAVATFGPLLVLGPWTGALADRVDKHRLFMATQLLMIVQALVFGALVLSGFTGMAVVYGLTAFYGVVHAYEAPVRRAIVAELVNEERIPRAVSLSNLTSALGRVAGPLCASVLIATSGIGWCFIASAVSYALGLLALRPMCRAAFRTNLPTREPGAVRAGIRYAWMTPDLRMTLLLTGVVATFGFNHQVVIPLLASTTFHGGAVAYTLLYTAMSAGSVAGALVVAGRREITHVALIRTSVAFAVANCLLAAAPNLPVAVGASFATGATALAFMSASVALLQQRCAPAMRGRVMALYAVVLLGGVPIGAPLVGFLADAAGPRAAVAVGSVIAGIAAIYVSAKAKSYRNVGAAISAQVR